ncbi:hypothetical protein DFH06DRAFT_1154934 [Mycena polygramma]|nr:hypothetical protein DFH06DRAFT_1154934 [Mycena polygramma]
MAFGQLDADVLLEIFAFTDVYTITSLARVNRLFHSISLIKHLWLSIVPELAIARLIDAPVDGNLKALSTEELMGEVRRVVAGPKTWSPASSIPPTLQRQFRFLLDKNALNAGCPPKLLPGGTHLVVYISGPANHQISGFEYWEVHTGRRVWKWEHAEYRVVHVVSDLREGKLVVLIAFFDDHQTYSTLVLEVDLVSGDSTTLGRSAINPTFSPDPQLCEDFVAMNAFSWGSMPPATVLVNWRTAECIVFDSEPIVCYALFPGHLMLGYTSRYINLRILDLRLYAISSFDGLWRPVNQLASNRTHTDLDGVPSVFCSVANIDINPECMNFIISREQGPRISVMRSLLHRDTYDCVVELVNEVHPPPTPPPTSLLKRLQNKFNGTPSSPDGTVTRLTKVFRYSLVFPSDAKTISSPALPQFRPKSIRCCPSYLPRLTRAGYNLSYSAGRPLVVQWASDNGTEEAPLPVSSKEPLLSADVTRSGALLEFDDKNGVVVSYYQ